MSNDVLCTSQLYAQACGVIRRMPRRDSFDYIDDDGEPHSLESSNAGVGDEKKRQVARLQAIMSHNFGSPVLYRNDEGRGQAAQNDKSDDSDLDESADPPSRRVASTGSFLGGLMRQMSKSTALLPRASRVSPLILSLVDLFLCMHLTLAFSMYGLLGFVGRASTRAGRHPYSGRWRHWPACPRPCYSVTKECLRSTAVSYAVLLTVRPYLVSCMKLIENSELSAHLLVETGPSPWPHPRSRW